MNTGSDRLKASSPPPSRKASHRVWERKPSGPTRLVLCTQFNLECFPFCREMEIHYLWCSKSSLITWLLVDFEHAVRVNKPEVVFCDRRRRAGDAPKHCDGKHDTELMLGTLTSILVNTPLFTCRRLLSVPCLYLYPPPPPCTLYFLDALDAPTACRLTRQNDFIFQRSLENSYVCFQDKLWCRLQKEYT